MLRRLKRLIPRRVTEFFHLLQAVVAVAYYGHPSQGMTVIGITGTDGKTTSSYLVYEILKKAGKRVSLVTSVGAILHGADKATEPIGLHVTTPGPFFTQNLLRQAKAAGSEYVMLETTSHGLAQHRVWGIRYHIGGITNITNEHLDYHGTYEGYLRDKARLLRNVEYSILNRDDRSYEMLKPLADGRVLTYSISGIPADVTAQAIEMSPTGTSFHVPALGQTIHTKFLGEYNVQNALLAITITRLLGISDEHIVAALEEATPPPGRLERVDMGQDFTVYVDFAHTSNGLESVLKLLNTVKTHRLIAVFGCAGERDPHKRFPMGASAGRYCDYTVITAEDPRTEDLDTIMDEVGRGCESEGGVRDETYFCIGDRQEAINYAIRKLAQPGDIVVTTGKAHEASMCFGTTEYPWNEFDAVHNALRARLADKGQA